MSVKMWDGARKALIAGRGMMDSQLDANSNNGVKNRVVTGKIEQINADLSDTNGRITTLDGKTVKTANGLIVTKTYVNNNGNPYYDEAFTANNINYIHRRYLLAGSNVDQLFSKAANAANYTLVQNNNLNLLGFDRWTGIGVAEWGQDVSITGYNIILYGFLNKTNGRFQNFETYIPSAQGGQERDVAGIHIGMNSNTILFHTDTGASIGPYLQLHVWGAK